MTEQRCGTCKFYNPREDYKCEAPMPCCGVRSWSLSAYLTPESGTTCRAWQERPRMTIGEAYRIACGYRETSDMPSWVDISPELRASYERRAVESMKRHAAMIRIYREHNGEENDPNT